VTTTTKGLAAFEEAVLNHSPPGAVVVGVSISPDGQYGAAATLLPSASDYWMNDLYTRVTGQWETYAGGNGDLSWRSLPDPLIGVLSFGGEAPPATTSAWIAYEGQERRVPVRHAHFLFVAWRTAYREDPRVVRFEKDGRAS
jgi:hypothetical protein